ncbi:MAG: right-handed parallel beta-helix repeat-containing protein [Gloeocapsa sp. UFS-A4-WI-NPMV-4B04]|nr:right-handed parallel beta-helix repeat-containing protein [Gloeocapsa sp. UFS-A4-WI-NPMV-4B04]
MKKKRLSSKNPQLRFSRRNFLILISGGLALASGANATNSLPSFVIITAKDINGSTPFTIIKPGQYILVEDVSWNAPNPNARAITIASDNVTFDFGGRTLQQSNKPTPITESSSKNRVCSGETISGNAGIWVEGKRGITIKNGTVLNVQGVGIVTKDCHHVALLDLTVRNCGSNGVVNTSFLCRNGGIFVMGTKDKNNKIVFSSDIRIINCICSNNASQLDFVVTLGALALFCDNLQVKNCVFNHTANTSSKPSGVQFNVVGIDFVICRNILVEDCEAHDNTSGGEPAGFFAWGENYKFVRCRANRNYTLTGNRACGFNISTTNSLEMIDCEADGNYNANPNASNDDVKDFSAAGYRIGRAVYRGLIENCRAIGNNSVGVNAPAAGFLLNSANQMVLRNCVAIGNRNSNGTENNNGFAAGFLASTTLSSPNGGFIGGEGNSFINCLADSNTVDQTPLFVQSPAPPVDAELLSGNPQKGAGFLLIDQKNPRILDCKTMNNKGKGIWLRGTRGALIEDNLLVDNTLYGIHDQSPAGLNTYVSNEARLNGFSHADNYVGLPPGTPVHNWTLDTHFETSPTKQFENTSISLR